MKMRCFNSILRLRNDYILNNLLQFSILLSIFHLFKHKRMGIPFRSVVSKLRVWQQIINKQNALHFWEKMLLLFCFCGFVFMFVHNKFNHASCVLAWTKTTGAKQASKMCCPFWEKCCCYFCSCVLCLCHVCILEDLVQVNWYKLIE